MHGKRFHRWQSCAWPRFGLIVVGCLVWVQPPSAAAQQPASAASASPRWTAQDVPDVTYSSDELINIAVYEKANRSVANIRTMFAGMDIFFRPVSGEGSGSGWVYDKNGHIVTNYHVIEESDRIEVTLYDGEKSDAQVIGVDTKNDIAVLKIDVPSDSLIPLQLGNSTNLKVGQKALAIGNPFGLERTLTVGIISSLNRTLESKSQRGRTIKSVIQVDAALNQGNSGGPLLDSTGSMIGMNTAIASASQRTAQNSGVGFAVPVNTIRRVVPQLLQFGRVIRASAGIYNAINTNRGLMIVLVEPNGPAERAGLRGAVSAVLRQYGNRIVVTGFRQNSTPGDFVKSVNGVKVDSWDSLLEEIEKYKPGTVVSFQITRSSRDMDVDVKLVEDE